MFVGCNYDISLQIKISVSTKITISKRNLNQTTLLDINL